MSCSSNPTNLPQQLTTLTERLDQIPLVSQHNFDNELEQTLHQRLQTQRRQLQQSVPVTVGELTTFDRAFGNQLNINDHRYQECKDPIQISQKSHELTYFIGEWQQPRSNAEPEAQRPSFHPPMMFAPRYNMPVYGTDRMGSAPPTNLQDENHISNMLNSALDGVSEHQPLNDQHSDEDLSEIAGQMLANLPLEGNPKLKNSQFVSWLRMVKEQRLVVQGNDLVEKD